MKNEFIGIEIVADNQSFEFQVQGTYEASQKEHEGKVVHDLNLDFNTEDESSDEVLEWFLKARKEHKAFKLQLRTENNEKLETEVSKVGQAVVSDTVKYIELID